MINPKFSIIFSLFGFVLSFLVALISGVTFPFVLIRALSIAAIFFAISIVVHLLLSHFLPELVSLQPVEAATVADEEYATLGSAVDVTVGSDPAADGFRSVTSGNNDGLTGDSVSQTTNPLPTAELKSHADPVADNAKTDVKTLDDLPVFGDFAETPVSATVKNAGTDVKVDALGSSPSSKEAGSMARAIQTMLAHDD